MKCSVCGKEFGSGANCQYCGVDRVTGLGNYYGYNTPAKSSDSGMHSSVGMAHLSATNQHQMSTAGSTICYACGEIIPADSKFCPYCSKELYATCPICGNKYSSQFPACNQCGTNRYKYYEQKRKEQEIQDRLKWEKIMNEMKEKQKLKESTPEGRAELEREKQIMDEYRKKWKGVKL